MKSKRIYIDMDNTLFDFDGEFQRRKDECEFPQSKYGFFLNLEPLPDAIETVQWLVEQGHDVWFATRPSFHNPLSYTEKRICIENHFGFEMVKKLILIPDKSLLKGDYLIDDSVSDGQLDFKGHLIRFGSIGSSSFSSSAIRSWKKFKNHWFEIEKYLNSFENTDKIDASC